MGVTTFFFDTYALYEIVKGNANYMPYTEGIAIITTKLNLMELFYGLLVNHGANVANKNYDYFSQYCIGISDEIIKKAVSFRAMNKGKGLSYIDCIGYVLSIELKIQFLTGDGAFENMPNVEFIK